MHKCKYNNQQELTYKSNSLRYPGVFSYFLKSLDSGHCHVESKCPKIVQNTQGLLNKTISGNPQARWQ